MDKTNKEISQILSTFVLAIRKIRKDNSEFSSEIKSRLDEIVAKQEAENEKMGELSSSEIKTLKTDIEVLVEGLQTELSAETEAKTASLLKQIETLRSDLENHGDHGVLQTKDEILNFIKDEKSAIIRRHEDIIGVLSKDLKSQITSLNSWNESENERVKTLILENLPEQIEHKAETPEDLRDKLESLEGDNRLDVSAIKGIENLKGTTVFGGGGGIKRIIGGTGVTVTETHPKVYTITVKDGEDTFEKISLNTRGAKITDWEQDADEDYTSFTFDDGIIKSFGYDVYKNVVTITLSGNIPSGIPTVKTYYFSDAANGVYAKDMTSYA